MRTGYWLDDFGTQDWRSKGSGALVLDERVEIEPLIAGGGHERGLRSGTGKMSRRLSDSVWPAIC